MPRRRGRRRVRSPLTRFQSYPSDLTCIRAHTKQPPRPLTKTHFFMTHVSAACPPVASAQRMWFPTAGAVRQLLPFEKRDNQGHFSLYDFLFTYRMIYVPVVILVQFFSHYPEICSCSERVCPPPTLPRGFFKGGAVHPLQ